jgi:omega-amidase
MIDIDPACSPADNKTANLKSAKAAVEAAHKASGADILVLPECFNCPYDTAQFRPYSEPIPNNAAAINEQEHPSVAMLSKLASQLDAYIIGGTIPELRDDNVYNTSVVLDPKGEIVAKFSKVHLFDIDIPDKPGQPGKTFRESDTLTAGSGISTFDTPWCKVGVAICYDIRFPQLASLMRQEGCEMIVYPGAFNTVTGPKHWELLQRARAVDNQCVVVTASPARNPASSYQAWGHSTIVDPWGAILATCDHEPTHISAQIDLDQVEAFRTGVPISKQVRLDVYQEVAPAKK